MKYAHGSLCSWFMISLCVALTGCPNPTQGGDTGGQAGGRPEAGSGGSKAGSGGSEAGSGGSEMGRGGSEVGSGGSEAGRGGSEVGSGGSEVGSGGSGGTVHGPLLLCGDGALQAGELCDDGNLAGGDGCSAECQPESGFDCSGEGPGACVDIDECAEGLAQCSHLAVCNNTPGAFFCECKPGFTGDGQLCVDIDECHASSEPCRPDHLCVNVDGGYFCQPPPCEPPTTYCGSGCVNPRSDPENCGDCGHACAAGEACLDGLCALP